MAAEKPILSILNNRILRHSMFWMCYVLIFGLLYGKYGDNYFFYIKESLFMLPFMMVAAYVIIYCFLPGYLRIHKLIYVVSAFLILFLVVLLQRITLRLINDLAVDLNRLFDLSFLYMFLETSFMVGAAIVIKLVKRAVEQQQDRLEIEKQNLQAELKLLKAQIQPHFLFNTMNNLYALSLDQSVKTSEGIAKISELLSIILYECNEQFIKLDKEVRLLQNYIDLEKLRYDKRLEVSFDVEGELIGKKVAPMLFITFLENCFKHGSSSSPNFPWIKINLTANNDEVIFRAENSIRIAHAKSDRDAHGIGLQNVKRRLDLLYENSYNLNIQHLNDRFLVELKLHTA